ncbi:MAG TPA: hypothetical protein ENJ82_02400 [Bacteroidetes bacterium]|nr:hypothetical protein [Bacteroidota bacterium]
MKKRFTFFVMGILLLLAVPQAANAQCPSNADSNPCYNLPAGPCVCAPSGLLHFWVAGPVIAKGLQHLSPEYPTYGFWQFLRAYYVTRELKITYLGGTWSSGQSFYLQMDGGGGIGIILTDGGF